MARSITRVLTPDASTDAISDVDEFVHAALAAGETVTVARHMPELSPSEVAATLGISRANVQRRIVSGDIHARRVGSRYRVTATEVERVRRAWTRSPGEDTTDSRMPEHIYPAVYRQVLFPFLDGSGDRYFEATTVTDTKADRDALSQLLRGGAVIEWGDRLSLGLPHKALMVFAAGELARPRRMRWSPPDLCGDLINTGQLLPGSADVVVRHFALDPNPIGAPPDVVWHGAGPVEYTTTARPGWAPWVDDGLTGHVPLAVAYADLFCVSDWRADEYADYILRKTLPQEG